MTENEMDVYAATLVGLWAVNGAGVLGKIERFERESGLFYYHGTSVVGDAWKSACPMILSSEMQTYLNG